MSPADWQPVLAAARAQDQRDPLARFRQEFHLPVTASGKPQVYLLGNSLGLLPRRTESAVQQVLDAWARHAAAAHFSGDFPWMPYHETLSQPMADLVGATPAEVVMMNSLTVNLHLMLATFYAPTSQRHRILMESHAFPSDRYAVDSQIHWHDGDPGHSLLELPLDVLCDPDQICALIERHAKTLAVVLLPGVQYYTGQRLDARSIVREAHRHGICVGLDLAHAVGNVPLSLRDDDVDFAVWCSYKYLNGGPGSVGGCFVHERHHRNVRRPRLAGWWGHDKSSRFRMPEAFQPIPSAEGWQLSNPPILSLAAIRAALNVFAEAGGIPPLREKSRRLTGYLEQLLDAYLPRQVRSITPRDPQWRGCQLSLVISEGGGDLATRLEQRGILTDWREPDVLRVAPVPLYNSFEDVARFVMTLSDLLTGSE